MIKWRLVQVLAVFFWASAFVGIRYAMKSFSAEGMALLRYLIASLCMGIIYYFTMKRHPKRRWREILPVMVVGLFGFSIYNVLLNRGEAFITAAIASFINGLTPVIVAVLAIWVYGERLRRRALWGFAISLFGIGLIVVSDYGATSSLWGILMTSLAILSGAVYVVLQKKMTSRMSPIEFTSYAIWGGTFALLIFVPQLYCDLKRVSLIPILVVIYLGIFPGALAYLLSSYGFHHLPVAEATSISYLIPLLSTILALLCLQEFPSWLSLGRGVIALSGAIIVNQRRVT